MNGAFAEKTLAWATCSASVGAVTSKGPMQNSYLRLEHEAVPHHPLFQGLEDAPRIVNGVSRLVVEPRVEFAPAPLTLIPSYPDLPMEMVYPRQSKTDIAGVYLRETGSGHGRVVYFPGGVLI